MSYETTQRKLQHKRRVTRRRDALASQIDFIDNLICQYEQVEWTREVDKTRVMAYLTEISNHLRYSVNRYNRYLDWMRGMYDEIRD